MRSHIGVRRMGELDTKPFMEAMKIKYCLEDLEDWAVEVIQLWEEYLKDPDWHPFKRIKLETAETVVVFFLPYITNLNRLCSYFLSSIISCLNITSRRYAFMCMRTTASCILHMQICLCMLDLVYGLVSDI